MQLAITIDRFGRMVIPKSVRDDLGLRPGDYVQAEVSHDAIVLRPAARVDPLRKEGGVLVFTGSAAGDIADALSSLREERVDLVAESGGYRP